MKIFERRMRVSWLTFFMFALPFSTLASFALATDHALVLRGRFGRTHLFLREEKPDLFVAIVVFYVSIALAGWIFSFYRFHRESWFST